MKDAFPFNIGTVHIIGIGGIGMSGYAEVLHHMGYKVQGSDMSENPNVKRLKELGIRVSIGHNDSNILDENKELCSVVVKSTAVKDDNPEIISAKARHVPVIPRVQLLAEIMRSKWCINISGTHGKTTTTSIIGHMLEDNDLDPTIINGGIINSYGSNARMGNSDWMIVEADESDGTFAKLPSVASIITNIDPEHLDYYKDFDTLKKAFISYVHNLPFYGFVVACIDHPTVAELLPQFQRRTITYGFSQEADIRAVNIRNLPDGVAYDLEFNTNLSNFPHKFSNVKLPLFGSHNILNSLTAFAIGHELGLGVENIVASLAKSSGVKRRFTTAGIVNDITIIDDYAHHPVEIKAVLQAGRDALNGKQNGGKLIAILQPHRYSRVENLFESFCSCFDNADSIVIADIYSAGETPIAGINKESLINGIKKHGKENVYRLSAPQDLSQLISDIARPGDIVVCMGAGNITSWAYQLPNELEEIFNSKNLSSVAS